MVSKSMNINKGLFIGLIIVLVLVVMFFISGQVGLGGGGEGLVEEEGVFIELTNDEIDALPVEERVKYNMELYERTRFKADEQVYEQLNALGFRLSRDETRYALVDLHSPLVEEVEDPFVIMSKKDNVVAYLSDVTDTKILGVVDEFIKKGIDRYKDHFITNIVQDIGLSFALVDVLVDADREGGIGGLDRYILTLKLQRDSDARWVIISEVE